MARTPSLPLAIALAALAAFAFAASASPWLSGQKMPLALAGWALALLALLALRPWAGKRPSAPVANACHKCGTAPPPSGPGDFCLMCGAFPRVARVAG